MEQLVVKRIVNLTTTQINNISSPTSGMQAFDTDLGVLKIYSNGSWINTDRIKAGILSFIPETVQSSTRLVQMIYDTETTFPSGVPNSVAKLQVAPTATVTFDIHRVTVGGADSIVGTIGFTNGSVNGVFTFPNIVVCPIGDTIYIDAPADIAGMGGLFLNILGYSKLPVY